MTQTSPNTWDYGGFTLTYGKGPEPCFEHWTYCPKAGTPEEQKNKNKLHLLRQLHGLLPSAPLVEKDGNSDYPTCLQNCPAFGADMHDRREVWTLHGYLFFRRYNDDWNGQVMGRGQFGWRSLSMEALAQLVGLIQTKGYQGVSKEEVDNALKL